MDLVFYLVQVSEYPTMILDRLLGLNKVRLLGLLCLPLLAITNSSMAADIEAKNYNNLPVIILKMDDLVNYKDAGRSSHEANWDRVVSYLKSTKVLKGNLGGVGGHFRGSGSTDVAFRNDVKNDLVGSNVVEIFNHADCFCPDDFSANYNTQYLNINQANSSLESALGPAPIAFGSPGNKKNVYTLEAVNNHPDIKVWFYGADQISGSNLNKSKVLNLKRMSGTDIDSIGSTSKFLSSFEALKSEPYVVYQGHPGTWTDAQFNLFKNSFNALIAKYPKIKSMTVSDYYDYSKGDSASASSVIAPMPPTNITVTVE